MTSPHPPLMRTPPYCPSRALDLDKRRISPCREACPLGVNAQAYLALTAVGRFQEALAVVRRDNPLPGHLWACMSVTLVTGVSARASGRGYRHLRCEKIPRRLGTHARSSTSA